MVEQYHKAKTLFLGSFYTGLNFRAQLIVLLCALSRPLLSDCLLCIPFRICETILLKIFVKYTNTPGQHVRNLKDNSDLFSGGVKFHKYTLN